MSNTYNYIDFTDYVVDFKSIETTFNKLHNKLEQLQFVEVNDKIGFDDNEILYVTKYNSYQHVLRWYYNQSRYTTINKLNDIITEYTKLLQMIRISFSHMKSFNNDSIGITDKIRKFNKKILYGLNNLHKTYIDDENYGKLIKDCLNTICNFEKKYG